tara:strand:+ start:78 stop:209 length:132 start_codon:yes stop_codon:yes gene_type:complete
MFYDQPSYALFAGVKISAINKKPVLGDVDLARNQGSSVFNSIY